jgi:hypothetical protein
VSAGHSTSSTCADVVRIANKHFKFKPWAFAYKGRNLTV